MALRRKAATLTLVIGMVAATSAGSSDTTGSADAADTIGASSGRIASRSVDGGAAIIQLDTRRARQTPDGDTPLPPAA